MLNTTVTPPVRHFVSRIADGAFAIEVDVDAWAAAKGGSMTDLLPTGQCFDDALEFICERVKESPPLAHLATLILVHGIARATNGSSDLYAHAWVEEDGMCWDAALLNGQRIYYSVGREEFYEARQIHDTTRYTIREACLENVRTHHYGPWVPQYRALCGGRIMGAIPADATHATIKTVRSKEST